MNVSGWHNHITIKGLDLPTVIGVPEEERARAQYLKADVTFEIQTSFEKMNEDLGQTVDYSVVSENLKNLALSKPRLLLETLISEMTAELFKNPIIVSTDITLHKRILPGVDQVSIRMSRTRETWCLEQPRL